MEGKKFFEEYNKCRALMMKNAKKSDNPNITDKSIFSMLEIINKYLNSMKAKCSKTTYRYVCKRSSQMLEKDIEFMEDNVCNFVLFANQFILEGEFIKKPEVVVKMYKRFCEKLVLQLQKMEFGLNTTSVVNQSLETLDYILVQYAKLLSKEGNRGEIKRFINLLSGKAVNSPVIFMVIPEFSGKYKDLDKKMNLFLQRNEKDFIRWMINRKSSRTLDRLQRKDMDCYVTKDRESGVADRNWKSIKYIIHELLENSGCSLIDIRVCGEGGYSTTYQIGEKVLKIGSCRQTKNIPYHKRILQPVIRMEFEEYDMKNPKKAGLFVEVADNVIIDNDLTKEYLLDICKALYRDGIVWTDPKEGNVGILKSFNVPTMHGKEISVATTSSGITEYQQDDKPLERGEIVIIDTDYIYKVGDKNITWGISREVDEFKKWYTEHEAKRLSTENR